MSRGWIRLASKNPLDKPLVNPNYLGVESDLERLVQAVKIARQIFGTQAFSSWVKQELMPGLDLQTEAQLRDFVRQSADSYYHQIGSCKMGLDAMAVVAPHYGSMGWKDAGSLTQVSCLLSPLETATQAS